MTIDTRTALYRSDLGSGLRKAATIVSNGGDLVAALKAAADAIDPSVTPAPTPVPVPPLPTGGFTGRIDPGTSWRKVFEDDFNTPCSEGQFLSTYGKNWDAYPVEYLSTDRKGHYDPQYLSVINGAMNMHLMPGNMITSGTYKGKAAGNAPYPKLPSQGDSSTLYKRVAARLRCPDPVAGWNTAWLEWPDSENWPHDGELDWCEGSLTDTMNANHHNMNGTAGDDQQSFDSGVKYTGWVIVEFEWTKDHCLYSFTPDGGTAKQFRVTSRIPSTPMHTVLQTEPVGGPTHDCHLQVDWITTWVVA